MAYSSVTWLQTYLPKARQRLTEKIILPQGSAEAAYSKKKYQIWNHVWIYTRISAYMYVPDSFCLGLVLVAQALWAIVWSYNNLSIKKEKETCPFS